MENDHSKGENRYEKTRRFQIGLLHQLGSDAAIFQYSVDDVFASNALFRSTFFFFVQLL